MVWECSRGKFSLFLDCQANFVPFDAYDNMGGGCSWVCLGTGVMHVIKYDRDDGHRRRVHGL